MPVTLRKRKNADGSISLRLDIYHDGKRVIETLNHLKLANPTTTDKRENNKELLRQAEAIRASRAAELEANDYKIIRDIGKKIKVTAWMEEYINQYQKKDIRCLQGVLNRFKNFLAKEKKEDITFFNLNPLLIENFIDYLENRSIGEGAISYYNRFKKMLRHAYRKRLLKEDVLGLVEKKASGKAAKKEILTIDEIKELLKTPVDSQEVRKAVIFSLMTGLAWIDAKNLKWENIDLKNKILKNARRSKTNEPITVPLNEAAIKSLGEPADDNSFVFNLPTANGANKTLKAWVKRAGINKKITYHNLRHSAGTNLAYNGVDLLTISKILAHSSTKHTMRYVDAANEMKIRATDLLNVNLNLG